MVRCGRCFFASLLVLSSWSLSASSGTLPELLNGIPGLQSSTSVVEGWSGEPNDCYRVTGRESSASSSFPPTTTQLPAASLPAVPRNLKTGTTIVGVRCRHGVVLGSDTRATDGEVVADRHCEKIHCLAPNIYCLGAGTAAHAEHVTREVAAELAKLRICECRVAPRLSGRVNGANSGGTGSFSPSFPFGILPNNTSDESATDGCYVIADDGPMDYRSRVLSAHWLLKKRMYADAGGRCALLVGGVDMFEGAQLVQIHPHGSSEKVQFGALGSGEMAATVFLEQNWHPDLSLREAVEVVVAAVSAGITNDLGSGSCIDLLVLTSPLPESPPERPSTSTSSSKLKATSSPPRLRARVRGLPRTPSLLHNYNRHGEKVP